MPRTQGPQRQLEFVEPTAMRWQDLAPLLRARVRDHLARLLHQIAGGVVETREAGDDQ